MVDQLPNHLTKENRQSILLIVVFDAIVQIAYLQCSPVIRLRCRHRRTVNETNCFALLIYVKLTRHFGLQSGKDNESNAIFAVA